MHENIKYEVAGRNPLSLCRIFFFFSEIVPCSPVCSLQYTVRSCAEQQKWTTFSPLSGQNSYIQGARGGPQNLIFIGILLFLLLRNPCKNLKSYDNPFWGKSNKAWKSAVILPEECGYIAGRVRLYCRKSAVIFPEECGYIAGRVWLYFCNENNGFPKLLS